MEEMETLIRWVLENLGPPRHPPDALHPVPPPRLQDARREADRDQALEKIYERAKELGIHYPYLGNVGGHPPYENTYCPPACGSPPVIERSGYAVRITGLEGHTCTECGGRIEYVSEIR